MRDREPPPTYVLDLPASASLDDLHDARAALAAATNYLDGEIVDIKSQVERATAERWALNKFADPLWFAKARAALRHKGRQRQQYQQYNAEISRRVRAVNEAKHGDRTTDGRDFITHAKRLLPAALYLEIWESVSAEREKAA